MDIFYEESAVAQNDAKGRKKYTALNILFWISAVFCGFFALMFIMNIPVIAYMIFWGLPMLTFLGFAILFYKWKSNVNVNYDYTFVSGDLRIAKVININKRKLVAKFDCQDIIQVGDVDSLSFNRFRADPATKLVLCTFNEQPAKGKFFMYIHVDYNGKKLFLLECREELLMNMLKFMKRTVLDHDYIPQEKKNK